MHPKKCKKQFRFVTWITQKFGAMFQFSHNLRRVQIVLLSWTGTTTILAREFRNESKDSSDILRIVFGNPRPIELAKSTSKDVQMLEWRSSRVNGCPLTVLVTLKSRSWIKEVFGAIRQSYVCQTPKSTKQTAIEVFVKTLISKIDTNRSVYILCIEII